MNRQVSRFAILLCVCIAPVSASAVDLPKTINVAKQQLQRNGVGTRQKYFMDLYTTGLYLLAPNQQAKSILNADELMAMRIVITSKMVSQQKMVDSLQEGFKNATGGNLQPIQKQIDQFRECFAEEITRGDTFDLVYAPKHGVVVMKNGKKKGVVAGLPFKKALFGIWLGDRPVDAGLKVALLGSSERR